MKVQRMTSSIIDTEPTETEEDLGDLARQDATRPLYRERAGAIKESPYQSTTKSHQEDHQ
jgi:hypothetical protein